MATFSQSTIEKGSDMVQDFLCSTCEDEKLIECANYYCESCLKFYCRKCSIMHGQLFKKHSPHGRSDMKKWPVAKKVEDFLLKCDVHKEENLSMFCKDHGQLCCNKCAFLNHRHCKMVMLLSDLIHNTSTDLKQVSDTIQTILAELKKLQDNQEASIHSVQISYDEQLHKIQGTRQKILAILDMLEKKTLQEMKSTLTKLQALLKSDVEKCSTIRYELNKLRDAIEDIGEKGREELSLITSIKCQDKVQLFEKYQKTFVQVKSINFQPNNEIVPYLSKFSGLGKIENSTQKLTDRKNPDQVMRIDSKYEYDVLVQAESNEEYNCSIRDILFLPSGQVLIADYDNNNIKLLNQQYQLVSHCRLSGQPRGMSQVTPSEVGITVGSVIQFIEVNNNGLVADIKLQLQHECRSIVFHDGDLFITSGTALYKYSMRGKLVSKLHENKSDDYTVWWCAVSPTGDKLYITNVPQHELLTLARNGSVLATFRDPELKWPTAVHVTPAGQVLVCGKVSNTILQVHSMGSRKLATLATEKDGLQDPWSVCYNSHTDSIIVGRLGNKKILVYKVK